MGHSIQDEVNRTAALLEAALRHRNDLIHGFISVNEAGLLTAVNMAKKPRSRIPRAVHHEEIVKLNLELRKAGRNFMMSLVEVIKLRLVARPSKR